MKDFDKLKNIPSELKTRCVWCCWKLNEKGKVPYNPIDGSLVKSNKKDTFTSYTDILNFVNNYDGVGIGIFNGYSAIDIDDCVKDGELSEMAADIINHCNSYTEYSPSGEGIRIIFRTKTVLDKNKYYIKNSKKGLEIYLSEQTNKFVSMTGNTLSINSEISEVDLQPILDKYMTRYSDLESAIMKDAKLNELWNKKAPGSNSDESETDLALCDKLAFYLKGDYVAIEEAFAQSPYFLSKDEKHKKKWMNGDYRRNCINMAIRSVTTVPVTIKSNKYTISDKIWASHQRRKEENKKKGNGFGYSLFDENSEYTSTISARYYKDGSEILVKQENKNPRKLTPREAARLQGFPDDFKLVCSDMQCYKQFGNSVPTKMIEAVAINIVKSLKGENY